MQIRQEPFLDMLGIPETQFVIPVFQRVYSWGARQCEELWNDILAAGRTDSSHFVGILLYYPDPEDWGQFGQLDIIDGQQRMTTLTIMISALEKHLRKMGASIDGIDANYLMTHYLHADGSEGSPCKLVLSHIDTETLFALIDDAEMPDESASRILDNFEIFASKMRSEEFDARILWRGLQRLEIISALLTGQDSPQLVFESLNSKGMSLSTGDLVRNALLISSELETAGDLYAQYWEPIESLAFELYQSADATPLVNMWLVEEYRHVHLNDESEVYGIFKERLKDVYGNSYAGLLKDLLAYSRKLVENSELRAVMEKSADEWLHGKPVKSISELKMFGD